MRGTIRVQDLDAGNFAQRTKWWHMLQIIRKDPTQTSEEAYKHLVQWIELKYKRYEKEKYRIRLEYLKKYRKEYTLIFKEMLDTWEENEDKNHSY